MKNLSISDCCGLLFLCIISLPAYSHESTLTHSCKAPVKPGNITSLMEQEIFQAQLVIFEQCMFNFIRNQQQQMQIHEQSAQSALDEWDNYYQTVR